LAYLTKFFPSNLAQKAKKLREVNFKRFIIFGIVFFCSKLIPFITPLFSSNFLKSVEDYGRLEYLLNAGTLLASFFILGLSSAYPYFNISLKQKTHSPFILHSIIIFVFSGCSILIIYIFPSLNIFRIIFIGSVFGLQILFSSILKTEQKISWAVVLDGGVVSVLLFYLFYLYGINNNNLNENTFLFALFIYTILVLSSMLLFLKTDHLLNITKYKEVLKYGLPVFISSLLTTLITTSNRVLIEYFLDLKAVAYFSFYSRITSVLVIIYQAIMFILFKRLYQEDLRKLDNLFLYLLMLFILVSTLLLFILPGFVLQNFKIYQDTSDSLFSLLYILSAQKVFWVVTALLESIIYREKLATEINYYLISIIVSIILVCYIAQFFGLLSLISICLIQSLGIFLYCETQFFLIQKKTGIYFEKVKALNRVLFLLTLIYIFI